MDDRTRALWQLQNRHDGDRYRLFSAVAAATDVERVLYPGAFVDVAPSFVWPDVTYNDLDRRAAKFFADEAGVAAIIAENGGPEGTIRFLAGDYATGLDVEDESVDLLISLYAGFISEHCTPALRCGGWLLVNPSHGDAAMASIDERYRLWGVVESRAGEYRVRTDDLEGYLIPKKPTDLTPSMLHELGRGVAYTRSPFAYLFERVR